MSVALSVEVSTFSVTDLLLIFMCFWVFVLVWVCFAQGCVYMNQGICWCVKEDLTG